MGYELSSEVKEVIINDDLEGVGDVHSFVYLNTLLPVVVEVKTGDNSLLTPIGLLSFSALLIGLTKKKKNN